MPEFLLRYKKPQGYLSEEQEASLKSAITAMAKEIAEKISELFFDLDVDWEIREFGICKTDSVFVVTGWFTDNDDIYAGLIPTFEDEVLAIMQKYAKTDQEVSCWWQRVKGQWNSAKGILE